MQLTTVDYNGYPITFREDGWFNATAAALRFSKRPTQWLRMRETAEYLSALADSKGNCDFLEQFSKIKDLDGESSKSQNQLLVLVKKTGYVITKSGSPESGGGTWLHPKLAVRFAQWLDVRFAIWCDEQIDTLIRNRNEWFKQRHASASSSKLLHAMVKETRESAGKEVHTHHFSNEHRMINWLLAGKFTGLNREGMAGWQLDFLAHFELRNAILLARDIEYEKRKDQLHEEAKIWILENAQRIASSNDPFQRLKA